MLAQWGLARAVGVPSSTYVYDEQSYYCGKVWL